MVLKTVIVIGIGLFIRLLSLINSKLVALLVVNKILNLINVKLPAYFLMIASLILTKMSLPAVRYCL